MGEDDVLEASMEYYEDLHIVEQRKDYRSISLVSVVGKIWDTSEKSTANDREVKLLRTCSIFVNQISTSRQLG